MPSPSANPKPRRAFRWRRVAVVATALTALLVVARAAAPQVLAARARSAFDQLPAHRVVLADVDANFWRGAYEIESLAIDRLDSGWVEPLLRATRLDLSVSWTGLARGAVVGEVAVQRPVVQLALDLRDDPADGARGEVAGRSDPLPEARALGTQREDWIDVVQDLMPLTINRARVTEGRLRLVVRTDGRPQRVDLRDLFATGTNLQNRYGEDERLPAEIDVAARIFEDGRFVGSLAVHPLVRPPRLELDLAVHGVDLARLAPLTNALYGLDASSGTLDLVLELAADEGAFEGYLKVLLHDVRILSLGDLASFAALFEVVSEGLSGLTAEALENQRHGLLAARIPLRGSFAESDLETGSLETLASVFHNAAVEALRAKLDGPRGDLDEGGS